jgi:hypothetical protein
MLTLPYTQHVIVPQFSDMPWIYDMQYIGAFYAINIADTTLGVIAVNNSGVARLLRQRRDQLANAGAGFCGIM